MKDAERAEAFEELGLPYGSTSHHIKKAYYELAKKYHTDRHPDANLEELKQLTDSFQRIGRAYDVLTKSETNDFLEAVKTGDQELMKEILRSGLGVDINQTDANGNTALILAVERGNKEVVSWLLKQTNININESNELHASALTTAVLGDVIKDEMGWIKYNTIIQQLNKEDREEVIKNRIEIARMLLEKGALIFEDDLSSARFNNLLILKILTDDENSGYSSFKMLFIKAFSDSQIAKAIFNKPLIAAACKGNLQIVQLYFDKANEQDKNKMLGEFFSSTSEKSILEWLRSNNFLIRNTLLAVCASTIFVLVFILMEHNTRLKSETHIDAVINRGHHEVANKFFDECLKALINNPNSIKEELRIKHALPTLHKYKNYLWNRLSNSSELFKDDNERIAILQSIKDSSKQDGKHYILHSIFAQSRGIMRELTNTVQNNAVHENPKNTGPVK